MGAGTALGVIDNPIQRERHTRHPMIVGSGIKGALRHACEAQLADAPNVADEKAKLTLVFGPDTQQSHEHAGALSLGDAQIVAFPVRSLKQTFVYATCPTALARLERLVEVACNGTPPGFPKRSVPQVGSTEAAILDDELLARESLVLEAFQFKKASSGDQELREFAKWLADNALPARPPYFAEKLKKHLVLLHDDWFNHFVQHATIVEPHVRINDASGTADDGGLFYTENLPPESLLVSVVMASRSRKAPKTGEGGEGMAQAIEMSADDVLSYVLGRVDSKLLQLGGDATTGRGQVIVRGFGWNGKERSNA
jgi:CRISPR-associated protein Cmr4